MDHGPGRAPLAKPLTGFDLGEDEGFGEQTGLLWDPATKYCLIQYNHFGPRAAAIAEYIALWDHEMPIDFEFVPKIDGTVHSKIKHKGIVRKFSMSVAPKMLSDSDYEAGSPLLSAVKGLGKTAADLITITVSVRGKSSGLDVSLPDMASWVKRLGGGNEDSPIGSAWATAKTNPGEAAEVLDLLSPQIKTDLKISSGVDRRYSVKDRWAALERARTGWNHLIQS